MECLHIGIDYRSASEVALTCPLCGYAFIFAGDGSLQAFSHLFKYAEEVAALHNNIDRARANRDAMALVNAYNELDRFVQRVSGERYNV